MEVVSCLGERRFWAKAEQMTELSKLSLRKVRLLSFSALSTLSDLRDEELNNIFKDVLGPELVLQLDDELAKELGLFRELVVLACAPASAKRARFAIMSEVQLSMEVVHKRANACVGCPSVPMSQDKIFANISPPTCRWPTRHKRKMALASSQEARAEAEEKERSRWMQELARIAEDNGYPVFVRAQASLNSERVLQSVGRGRRPRTMRTRIRAWNKLAFWCRAAHGLPGPAAPLHVIDYISERADEPCGRSVPRDILAAVAFVQKACGVADEHRLTIDQGLISHVEEITFDLAKHKPRPKRKAPQYPALLIVALELTVVDASTKRYLRAFSWFKLIKIWASLRHDDTEWMSPALMQLSADRLEMQLARTKTTGPGKKVEVLFAYVSPKASLCNEDWLRTGFELWKSFGFAREYFLAAPTPDLGGIRQARACYSTARSMTRALLKDLKRPRLTHDRWALTSEPLILDPHVTAFWTEHSERANMSSWALPAMIPKEHANLFGRCSPQGSDEYVRTQAEVVLDTQIKFSETLQQAFGRSDVMKESGIFQKLQDFLLNRRVEQKVVEAQIQIFDIWGDAAHQAGPRTPGIILDGLVPALAAGPEAITVSICGICGQLVEKLHHCQMPGCNTEACAQCGVCDAGGSFSCDSHDVVENDKPQLGDLVISITGSSAHRRLHQVGNCFRIPGIHYTNYEKVRGQDLQDQIYNSVCRSCWPQDDGVRLCAGQGAGLSNSDDSDHVDSSSSSSGSDGKAGSDEE